MSVRILDDVLVNKIAAGEVVERPASVVKELVENALDAGTKRLRLALKGGGRSLIRVTDDGSGMSRDDAMMALERHATSKIRTEDDLHAVATLGFRGEALPSIAAVSRFQLMTRLAEDDVGTAIRVEAGHLVDVADAGCAPGTEIDVRSLFYRTPVRRKFLRTTPTELGHCIEAVARQAMVRPDVDFAVDHEGREVLRAPRAADRAQRAHALLGDYGKALLPVAFEDRGFIVRGLVSPVGVHKSTTTGATYLYVNGRFVRDPVLRRGLNEAYRGLVPKGRYPVVVLEVRLDPTRVDVNVHPTKIEVRFRDPRDLVATVSGGLREALEGHGIRRPPVPPPRSAPPEPPVGPGLPLEPPRHDSGMVVAEGRGAAPDTTRLPASPPSEAAERLSPLPPPLPSEPGVPMPDVAAEPPSVAGDPILPVPRFRDLRVIGQFATTYILCEGAGQLVVIDQHAAHERVMLHQLMRDRDAHLGGAQRLLTPFVVDLPRARAEILRDRLDVLEALALEVEPLGPSSLVIKAVPTLLAHVDLKRLIEDLADEVAAGVETTTDADLVEKVLATMACHSAVRAHDPLTPYEMRSLLASLDEVDFGVCAHGRPVAIRLSEHELEHRFHRS